MKALKLNFHNQNIGLFGLATDEYCLVGHSISDEIVEKLEKALDVPVHKLKIAGTDLVGVFCVANENCLLVPGICFEEEIEELEKLNINFQVIKTDLTALGNNILCNSQGALVNPEFSAVVKKEIRKALGVKVVPGEIGAYGNTGAHGICTKNGCLISDEISKEELETVENLLNTPLIKGTINESPLIRSGLIANSKGYVFSSQLVRDEIFNLQEALYGEK